MIIVENIEKDFGDVKVLKGVDLKVYKGEVISIVGPSGAGKTTLLQIMGTLSRPSKGNIYINNVPVHELSDKNMAKFRNQNIGFVFQFHQLLPEFTAIENVIMPALIAGKDRKKSEEKAVEILDYLNLSHRLKHKPSELSGGEQQRVAVARALINDPEILLADEPSGNLDSKSQKDLHNLFFSLRQKFGHTIIVVTHNDELAHMSDRMITIIDGKIV